MPPPRSERELIELLPDEPRPPLNQTGGAQIGRSVFSLGLGVLLVAALAIGADRLFFGGGDETPSTESAIPDIKPDAAPLKTAPANPGGMQVPNQNQLVYQSIGPGANRAQPPAQLAPAVEQPQAPPLPQAPPPDQNSAPDSADARSLLANDESANPTPGSMPAQSALPPNLAALNHTIAPPNSTQAIGATSTASGAASSSPAQPAAPAPPATFQGSPFTLPDQIPNISVPGLPATSHAAQAAAPPKRPAAPAASPLSLLPDQSIPASSGPLSLVPVQTPPRKPTSPRPAARPQAAAAPAAAEPAPKPAAKPVAGGDYVVQLAAVGSEAAAHQEWAHLQSAQHDLLGGLGDETAQATVNGKIYWRLRAGPLSEASARSLCDALTKRGQRCIIAHR